MVSKFTRCQNARPDSEAKINASNINISGISLKKFRPNVETGGITQAYVGGEFIANNLKAFVETGKATAGGRFALFMMGLTAFMTPAACKLENWPFDRKIDVD